MAAFNSLTAPAPSLTVPVSLLDGVIQFVDVSSLLGKKALDEVAVHRASQKKASDLAPSLLEHMITLKVVPASQKAAAAAMLGSHAETLQLLKAATDKIAEKQTEIDTLKGVKPGTTKTAGDLGKAEETPVSGSAFGGSYQHTGEYNSLTSPMIGEKTAMVKESDRALLALIGK